MFPPKPVTNSKQPRSPDSQTAALEAMQTAERQQSAGHQPSIEQQNSQAERNDAATHAAVDSFDADPTQRRQLPLSTVVRVLDHQQQALSEIAAESDDMADGLQPLNTAQRRQAIEQRLSVQQPKRSLSNRTAAATTTGGQPVAAEHACNAQHDADIKHHRLHIANEHPAGSLIAPDAVTAQMVSDASETTPLVQRRLPTASEGSHPHSKHRPTGPVSSWKFWHQRSPSFRWFVIFLITLMPMGPHILKYGLTSIASYMMEDKDLHLTYAHLGAFQSALNIPSLILPFLGGMMLDVKGSKFGTLVCLTICLFGQLLFTISCWYRNYYAALGSRVLFGLGQGTTVVAQGRLAAHWFVGRELVFAIALTEASHDVAQWIAKVYAVPLTKAFHSWVAPLWLGCVFCAISLVTAIIYFNYVTGLVPHHKLSMDEHGDLHDDTARKKRPPRVQSARSETSSTSAGEGGVQYGDMQLTATQAFHLLDPTRFTSRFYMLCILHCLYANCWHLFSFVSVIYMQQVYHYTATTAAWVSSISSITGIFLCPAAGWLVDRVGYKIWFCTAAGLLTAAAFLLLALVDMWWVPVASMAMLSICISFVPTILRSSVPNVVHAALFGTAYGMYEISEAAGNLAGHWLVGLVRDKTGSYQLDLYVFSGMALIGSLLSIVLSVIDRKRQGVLNKPSHDASFHDASRAEKTIAEALTGGAGKQCKHNHDSYDDDQRRMHEHHQHHGYEEHNPLAPTADDLHVHLHISQPLSQPHDTAFGAGHKPCNKTLLRSPRPHKRPSKIAVDVIDTDAKPRHTNVAIV